MESAPSADPTDNELAARAAQRDRNAFDRLVDRHARPLAACLLRRRATSDAAELLRETLVKAWRGAVHFPGSSYRAWLFQMARSVEADAPGQETKAAAVERLLGKLDDRERELVRARFGGAEDLPAASARLGIETEASQDLVNQALGRLRGDPEPVVALVLPTMPADPTELAGWLERQVTCPDLGRLIAELSAVHGPADTTALLPDLSVVLAGGLGTLSEDRLRALLRNPLQLAALQDAVAEAASPYWDDLFHHPTLAKVVRRAQEPEELVPVRPVRRRYPRPPWYLQPWFVAVATTVMVLGTVLLHRTPRPSWGWNNARVVSRGETSAKRLTVLADAAEDWRSRPRHTPAELRRALREMRDGCTAILAADHRRLSPADRVWLLEKCVTWGTELDRHLADLQEGRSADQVRPEADATVEKLVQALREQAAD